MGSFGPLLPVFTLFGREPIQIVASSSIDAANAARGDGANSTHQLCFTGSAATRARTRASNAPEGSICGSSSSNPETARNSFTRTRQAAHTARCASTSRCSLTFSRPSTNGIICFSIRLQLMFPILPFLNSQILLPTVCPPTVPTPPATLHTPGTTTTSARFPNRPKSSRSLRNPAPHTCATAPPPAASPATCRSHAEDRKSTRLNSSHDQISYAVFC